MFTPTSAQRAVRHSIIAGLVTISTTVIGAAYQYTLGHGFNIPALLAFIVPFVAAQIVTLWHTLTLNPQLPQAEADTVRNLPAEIQALPSLITGLHGKFDQLIAFLVRPPAASSVSETPTAAVPAASPAPPRSQPAVSQPQFRSALPEISTPLAAISSSNSPLAQ